MEEFLLIALAVIYYVITYGHSPREQQRVVPRSKPEPEGLLRAGSNRRGRNGYHMSGRL
jgi:hypothetical protein